jgi:tRNA-2-methylthio-N6-dimethylallyladenosine synthase
VKTYYIWTVGCQMNEADSEKLARELEARGLRPAARLEEADVIVLNTCAVRQSAEEKTYSKLGELKHLKKARPEVLLAVGGCMVGPDHSDLQKRAPFVDLFFRPVQFGQLLTTVEQAVGRAPVAAPVLTPDGRVGVPLQLDPRLVRPDFVPAVGEGCVDEPSAVGKPNRPTRWVSVIHGCNRACTYCIVPLRRGREWSRPIPEIVEEVRGLVRDGAREVTLLGQIVDRYGRDLPGRPDLADLMAALHNIEGLWRIRFLTSHPADMTDRIIDAVAELPKVCEHINIPVQSGDDNVLRRMKRGYRVEHYRRLVEKIRARIPGVSLATDIIVGFCGETEAEFENTLKLLEEIRFDVVHVAMYSPRPGTAAYHWPDDVPPAVKKERLHRVEELQERIAREINSQLLGQEVEVLVEGQRKGKWEGRTRTNKLVFFEDERPWLGKLALVRIEKASPWSLQGTVVREVEFVEPPPVPLRPVAQIA